jgi:hypothetical protein
MTMLLSQGDAHNRFSAPSEARSAYRPGAAVRSVTWADATSFAYLPQELIPSKPRYVPVKIATCPTIPTGPGKRWLYLSQAR